MFTLELLRLQEVVKWCSKKFHS